MSHTESFLRAFEIVVDMLPLANVDAIGEALVSLKLRKGRLFFLGVGGSAANASHAVNDFRKIAGIESYTPTDNIAELTARTNDDGWRYTFEGWLQTSRLSSNDAVFVLSVGGGTDATSPNLVNALAFAKKQQAVILGIVGRDGGATLAYAHVCVLVPTVDERRVTPYVESVQSLLLHLVVTNPALLR